MREYSYGTHTSTLRVTHIPSTKCITVTATKANVGQKYFYKKRKSASVKQSLACLFQDCIDNIRNHCYVTKTTWRYVDCLKAYIFIKSYVLSGLKCLSLFLQMDNYIIWNWTFEKVEMKYVENAHSIADLKITWEKDTNVRLHKRKTFDKRLSRKCLASSH